MTESNTHKFIKDKIAVGLQEIGFDVRTEYRGIKAEGRIDVYACKPDGTCLKVEAVKTHIPNWLLVKLNGSIERNVEGKRQTTIQIDIETRELLDKAGDIHKETYNDIIRREIRLYKERKSKEQF